MQPACDVKRRRTAVSIAEEKDYTGMVDSLLAENKQLEDCACDVSNNLPPPAP